ncbi:MAG: MFS transporter [Asgard group archaeon]|nr:MFS transporter [Asgard group archaeon]
MDENVGTIELEAQKTSYRNVFLWSSYDAADTLFSQAIISIAFQPFILLLALENGITDYWTAFALMSVFMAVSNLLVALLGPFIGALSDTIGKRKPAVLISASVMCIATFGFMFWKNVWWACIMFVIANFGYQVGRMFYDSMIPFISKTEERGKTSGISGALSFLGTFAAIGLSMLAYEIWDKYSEPGMVFADPVTNPPEYRSIYYLFGIAVAAIILFAIPFLFSKEKENPNLNGFRQNLSIAKKSFRETLREIFVHRYKNAILFILAWFFVTDAANTTILYMQLVMVDGAGANPSQALYVIGIGGILAMIGAIGVGLLLDRWGPKKNFIINVFAWFFAVIICILACIKIDGVHILPWQIMYAVAFFIGLGFGGLWLIGRQFIFEIAPPDKVTQYQGFKQIAGRVSAIVSPLIFMGFLGLGNALGYNISNQYALALAPLLVFFLIGFFILLRYKDVHKAYLVGERAPYKRLEKKMLKEDRELEV